MSAQSNLINAAQDYAEDIEVCDEIAIELLGADDTTIPSAYIEFLSSIDTEKLEEQAEYLKGAIEAYAPFTSANSDFKKLVDDWDGDGAAAFETRWTNLTDKYIGYASEESETVTERLRIHNQQATNLVDAIKDAQNNCADLIRNELHDASSLWSDLGVVLGTASAGAGLGSIVPGLGTIVGGITGAIIAGFQIQADDSEIIQDQKDAIESLQEVATDLSPLVNLENDTDEELGELEYESPEVTLGGDWTQ